MATIYENYAKLRDKNHMTDYYVGKKAKLSRSMFTHWRKGVKPTRASIDTLAEFFSVPANYFYEGVDDEKTDDSSRAC